MRFNLTEHPQSYGTHWFEVMFVEEVHYAIVEEMEALERMDPEPWAGWLDLNERSVSVQECCGCQPRLAALDAVEFGKHMSTAGKFECTVTLDAFPCRCFAHKSCLPSVGSIQRVAAHYWKDAHGNWVPNDWPLSLPVAWHKPVSAL